jgi:hypothetical protein
MSKKRKKKKDTASKGSITHADGLIYGKLALIGTLLTTSPNKDPHLLKGKICQEDTGTESVSSYELTTFHMRGSCFPYFLSGGAFALSVKPL